jgi:hypothetical protein
MKPLKHLILGIVFATILFVIFPEIRLIQLGIIVASSVLIDVDHYFYYVYKKKKLNPFKAYRWYTSRRHKCCSLPKEQKRKIHFGTFCLHGIEILIILLLLGFFVSDIFYFILIGFTFHLLSDLSIEIIWYNRYNKLSVIYSFLKSKGLTFIEDM